MPPRRRQYRSPPLPRRTTWSAGEKVALWAVVCSCLATLGAPITTAAVKADDPPPSVSCQRLAQDYAEAIRRSPADRERILPGSDGRSTLTKDPQASACNLTPEDFGP